MPGVESRRRGCPSACRGRYGPRSIVSTTRPRAGWVRTLEDAVVPPVRFPPGSRCGRPADQIVRPGRSVENVRERLDGRLRRAPAGPGARGRMPSARATERSHRGLVRQFAKPLSGVTCSEGSNPSLSARNPRADGLGGPPSSDQWARRSSPLASESGCRLIVEIAGARTRAPVAQWIERQVADLKVVSSSLAGRANLVILSPDRD